MAEQRTTSRPWLDAGTAVDVRNRFVGTWSNGFEVADHVNEGYVIRRSSDGAILPDVVGRDDVQPDRRRWGMWRT